MCLNNIRISQQFEHNFLVEGQQFKGDAQAKTFAKVNGHFRNQCATKFKPGILLGFDQFVINTNQELIGNQPSVMDTQIYGPVLLVCIYNKFGNIITHDYFYQLFSQYGEIVKILIFDKAKVWKTFIEFTDIHSAKAALINLNNHVVFEDGSKMNIFPSKLKHIKLQNSNLGGVNYQQLKSEEQELDFHCEGTRARRSTMQQHSQPWAFNTHSHQYHSNSGMGKGSAQEMQSTFSFQSYSNKKKEGKSFNTFDVDEQFLQLARESQFFREIQREEENLRSSNRRKSKTIVTNPNLEQFVMENSPSKVLFIRSIPCEYTNKCLYNIFRNFGNVVRVIYMKDKFSGLIEFQTLQNAINAKDELNYAKAEMKIFYSHYETLSLRANTEGQECREYFKSNTDRNLNVNPPSQILYITMANPDLEEEIRQQFQKIKCPIYDMNWKLNGKDRWMCLADIGCIQKSLMAMGFLQNLQLSHGKQLKLSFTRSKISSSKSINSNHSFMSNNSDQNT